MTDELVKRLRDCANGSTWLFKTHQGDFGICDEAAARIDALTAERDRLRTALEDIIADCEADYPPSHGAIKYAAKLALKGETP